MNIEQIVRLWHLVLYLVLAVACGLNPTAGGAQTANSRISQDEVDLTKAREAHDRKAEANALHALGGDYNSAGQPQKSLESLTAARAIQREMGDHSGEAKTLTAIGEVYNGIGQPKKALDLLNQALPIQRKVVDRSGEAKTLTAIGEVYNGIGQPKKALDFLNHALVIQRKVVDRSGEAKTLTAIGEVYDGMGETQKAFQFYSQALPVAHEVQDIGGEATTLSDIGAFYATVGQPQKALEFYNQALPLERAVDNRSDEAVTLNNVASVYADIGQPQKALDLYNQAVSIEQNFSNLSNEAITLHAIGALYQDLGQSQEALDFYNRALLIERHVGDRRAEATTLSNIGGVYRDLGQRQKALRYLNQALPIERIVGDQGAEAITLHDIGAVFAEIGEPQKAREFYNQAIPIERKVGDRLTEAFTLWRLAALQGAGALKGYLAALRLATEVGDPNLQGFINTSLMEHFSKHKQPEVAIFFGKEAVNEYQQIRGNMRGLDKELQASFVQFKAGSYRTLANLLIDEGRIAEAEQVLGLLKDEEYFEFVRRDETEGSLKTTAALTAEEAEWEKQYREIGDRLVSLGKERGELLNKPKLTVEETQHLTQLEANLVIGNAAFEKFLDELATHFSTAAEANVKIEQLRETQGIMGDLRELPKGTVAIYTLVGEDKYRAILVTPDVQKAYEYPIRAAELNHKVLEFRQVLENPTLDPRPLGQEMYKILMANLVADLRQAEAKTVMWSLDGSLRYLPVAALYDGKEYLIEQYALSVFTPASNARLKDRPDQEWNAAGFGVTKAFEGAPALPAVAAELSGIIEQQTGQGGILVGEIRLDDQFTEDAMRQTLLKHYAVVHIASHFRFQPGNETNSFLLLGDGNHLSLAELKNLPNLFGGVQLLTLSACNTGVGGTSGDGKEVEGLGVLAQRKGAKAVIASLWSVADVSTSLLMQEFYRIRESATTTKAEALQHAQLALLRGTMKNTEAAMASRGMHEPVVSQSRHEFPRFASDPKSPFAHPYYWAPFFLMGNWL